MDFTLFDSSFWQEFYKKAIGWSIENLPSLILSVILFFVSLKLLKVLIRSAKKLIMTKAIYNEETDLESEKRVNTLSGIIFGVGKIIIWIVFLMIVLGKFGLDIAPILAGAGIVGLAVGFGAQELVRDFISGFFILLENQIRVGDVAIIDGTGGLVEKIELRTTTLRDFAGVVHIFQNGKISTLANMTKEWSAMVFDIGVAYKEDTEGVIDVIKKVGTELRNNSTFGSKIIEDIEVFGLDKFGDSAIIIKARIKTVPGEQWTIGREFRKRLKSAFDEKDIEIPFPHVSVYWGEKINPLRLKMEELQKS
ncbi:MAG: mechanosensitive ion channel family protein [Bacteroidota bacterium]